MSNRFVLFDPDNLEHMYKFKDFYDNTKYLLDNYYAQTFFSIIGFTIGSVFVLYPGFTFDINGIISIISIFFGICISSIFK